MASSTGTINKDDHDAKNQSESEIANSTTDSLQTNRNILVLGASYGSLLASKFVLAGHRCTLVCRSATAKIFNENGSVVRMPIRGRDGLIDVTTHERLTAQTPDEVVLTADDGGGYDLVVLAMQEPQYSAPDVRQLVLRVAAARLPVMAITNMPLPPYLERIPGLRGISQTNAEIRACYTDPELWDAFILPNNSDDPNGTASGEIGATAVTDLDDDVVGLFTQCSPDPQAFRPPQEPPNVLQVRLPTNFKAATFGGSSATAATSNELLRQLDRDVQAIEYSSEKIQLPVKLRVHDSVFVPLAKWAMLLAGNYRCIPPVGKDIISISQAVNGDVETSRRVYQWVNYLVVSMGGNEEDDLVPFEKYLAATTSLQNPSSAARALQGGALHIERVDKVVQLIGRQRGDRLDAIDDVVQNVDDWLAHNKEQK